MFNNCWQCMFYRESKSDCKSHCFKCNKYSNFKLWLLGDNKVKQ